MLRFERCLSRGRAFAGVVLLAAGCVWPPPRDAKPSASQDVVFVRVFDAARAVLDERFEVVSAAATLPEDPAAGEIRALYPRERFPVGAPPRKVVRAVVKTKSDGGVDVEVWCEPLHERRQVLYVRQKDENSPGFVSHDRDAVLEREVRDLILERIGGPAGLLPPRAPKPARVDL